MLKAVTKESILKFELAVSDLLLPHNSKRTSLLRFIRYTADRYHLNFFDAEEILSESILRGLNYISRTGKEIHVPEAWLRATALHILRDQVRDNIRQEKIIDEMVNFHSEINASSIQNLASAQHGKISISNNDPALKLEWEDQLKIIAQARQKLSEEDQEILELFLFGSIGSIMLM